MIGTNLAVVIVTFIQHETVVAIVAATGLRSTLARRILLGFGFLPYIGCITNEDIYTQDVNKSLWGDRVEAYSYVSSSIHLAWAVRVEEAKRHQKVA